jgi:hypothetical protein
VLACAIAVLLYRNALDAPFVFDDGSSVLLNPSLVNPWDLRGILFFNIARPVLNLSYAVDGATWGLSSLGFHATNAILHVVVVGLFYGWCTRALTDARSDRASAPEWPAFFAAAIFAVHPVMTSTVLYVSARSELLCAAGMISALIFARRAIVASSTAAAVMAFACGAAAVGSSSSAAALPLVVLAYDAWVLQDAGWRQRMRRLYLPSMAAIALAAAWQLPHVLAADRVPPRGIGANVLGEAVVVCRYVGLLIYPHAQALVHEVRWAGWRDPAALAASIGGAAVTAALVRARRARPLPAFGVVWFLAVLAPSILVPLRDGMTEQREYVAAAGLLLAAVSVLAAPLARMRAVRAAGAAALVLLTFLTLGRMRVWREPLALWEEAVARSPGAWQAHLGYADQLRAIHRCDSARSEYRQVLVLYPAQRDAVIGLDACRSLQPDH